MHTYWAYVYNPNTGGTFKVPIPAEQFNDAQAIAESTYRENLRAVKVYED